MSRPAGPWGAWATGLRLRPVEEACEAAATLEAAGFDALWTTGGTGDPFERVTALLRATDRATVATGILSIWEMDAPAVAKAVESLPAELRERFLLGLGVSHQQLVDRAEPGRYARPLTRMREYLDELDASGIGGTSAPHRVLAALGPRMLDLSAERALGAHPYLTTIEHTRSARDRLGNAFLAPTQMVLLDDRAETARSAARAHLAPYLRQPNYVRSWVRQGFQESDASDGGSDRLVDALVAWGDPERIVSRVRRHLDAGADHVCLQVLAPGGRWSDHALPLEDWRRLGAALTT